MRLIFLLLLVGLASGSQAASREEHLKICEADALLAESIMQARQTGVPMHQLMKVMKGDRYDQKLVSMAFEYPRVTSEENQQAAISDFQSTIYKICFDRAPDK